MALMDNRQIYPISGIDTSRGLWTVKVQVVEIHRPQLSMGKNGAQPRTYKRYLLVDEHGTKVSAVLYDNDIHYFSTSLQPFKRYMISNAKLTPAFSFFKVGPYMFTWVISNDTPVELIDEPVVPPLPFSYDVCPFNQFINHVDKDFGFNIKGIVVQAFPRRQVTSKSSHREFVIIDESKNPVIMTLWNSYGDEEGSAIANKMGNLPVVIGVNMKSTTYHGLSLGTRMYSCILVDPPLADNPSLKEWYNNNKAEITQMLNAGTYKDTDLLLPPPVPGAAIDVPTAISTLLRNNSAWVAGKIHFIASNQQYYLIACQNCHKKASAGPNWFIHCSSCGAKKEVEIRCRVPIELTGGDKSLQLVLTSPDVERLTGITGPQLRDSHEFDFHVEDDLQIALDRLDVVCFVKRYDRAEMGNPGTHGLRYSVIKVHTMDAVNAAHALPAPASSALEQPPADVEKPFFTPSTKKLLAEIEGTSSTTKPAHPSPPAKRSLEFMCAPVGVNTPPDTLLPANDDAVLSQGTDEAASVEENVVKKGRDKLKMN